MSDSGSEGGQHGESRGLLDPTRTQRHLSVVMVTGDGVVTVEQRGSTLVGDIGVAVDQQCCCLVGGQLASTDQQWSCLVGGGKTSSKQRFTTKGGSSLAAPDRLHLIVSNIESCQSGGTSRLRPSSTSTPTDGHCSDKLSDSQIRRLMMSLQDLTEDDGACHSVGDALPLEAISVGRSVRCMGQSDTEDGRLYVSSQTGQGVGVYPRLPSVLQDDGNVSSGEFEIEIGRQGLHGRNSRPAHISRLARSVNNNNEEDLVNNTPAIILQGQTRTVTVRPLWASVHSPTSAHSHGTLCFNTSWHSQPHTT